MEIPLQISFRDMDPSPAIEAQIRERVGRLDHFFDRIMSCRVVVEARNRGQRKGTLYNLRIDVRPPGAELIVGRSGPLDHAHEDVHTAVRDAFDAMERRLQDHARRHRGAVKTHAVPDHGRVLRLFDDYGFIETSEGDEVYFHANAVVDGGFAHLTVGAAVRLVIVEGESAKGPQASTVIPLGKHHLEDVR
ncbi:MAG: HPF/RaiA family ribosome-associated protein [Alphaproteobacteria bacterium]